jgi:hypothetical protein
LYVITGSKKGTIGLYRIKESWDAVEELISFEELTGGGEIRHLVFTGKVDRDVLVAVGQGGYIQLYLI